MEEQQQVVDTISIVGQQHIWDHFKMAKADTVYSLFGMKTPQQVAQEQLQRQQALITRSARDPYQLAGASLGVALGRLFGGPSKEMEQAQEAQEVMRNFNEFGAEVEKEASERGMAPLDEVQMLNRRANELQAMSNRFSALGQPQDVVQNMSNEALKTRFLALDKQRQQEKFERDTAKYELDMQVGQARLKELQNKDKLKPAELAELQLRATPESYQLWLQGKGTLEPNPRAFASEKLPAAIKIWNKYSELKEQDPSGSLANEFLMVNKTMSPFIRDLNDRVSFRDPTDPTRELASVSKGVAPKDQPEQVAKAEEARTVARIQTEKKLNAPAQLANLTIFSSSLTQLKNHPGFTNAFGLGGAALSKISGSAAAGAKAKLDQVDAQSFLATIPQMKGLGALSDAEGSRVTRALTSLSQELSPEEARNEIDAVLGIISQIEARIQNEAFLTVEEVRTRPLAIPQQAQRTAGGTTYKVISQ